MNDFIYSDLAFENFGNFKTVKTSETNKTSQGTESLITQGDITISHIAITDEKEAEIYKCRQGNYITLFSKRISDMNDESFDNLVDATASQIRKALANNLNIPIDEKFRLLVAGLGNGNMAADSIGPLTVAKISVTGDIIPDKTRVFAVAPGVKGVTGMESSSVIKGIANECRPDAILVVDALAARDPFRIASTVQISDNGISPGSGIYNARREISYRTMKVPVIAIGVPTVVDSATLVYDALFSAGIRDIGDELCKILEEKRKLFVTPKDCDFIAKRVSSLLAMSIDKSLGI